ncbi:tRNA ligase [Monosporozyma unispora]|nr:hypothetical protein C6P44_002044 [Kazachstania unispora]
MTSIKELCQKLDDASKLASRGRAQRIECKLAHSDMTVSSWKFNEWDYGKNNITLPCNARGLFISDNKDDPKIIARGYDKFFNIDEAASTKWDWIKNNTVGPYEVSVKANGCIIFVSGLKDGSLVVCSKHSTGPREDVNRNHAEAGEEFLMRQLKELGVDSKELGKDLYTHNVTAVAEYCDDSFEEHILEYTGDKRGLYLHGINENKPEFYTWPLDKVTSFANKFGFKTVHFMIKNSISDLQKFLETCSENGSFEGKEIEGFVIRSNLKSDTSKPFFFKYKFEEPYLMYRQWREVTKDYIIKKVRTFKFRKHGFITNKYLDFVIPLLDNDPELCEQYMLGFGVIKLRNMFLKSYGLTGLEILNHEMVEGWETQNAIDYDKVDENTKFLIFPISVIGCGKTTTAVTLTNLFPESWGHIQNDDIHGKDKSMLMKKSLELLSQPNMKCVFVDRNNHQFRERKELFEWVDDLKEAYLPYDQNIKIIGISFAPYDKIDTIKRVTMKRVLARGDNHQTIKLEKYGEKKVLGIMSGFWKRYQPVNVNRSPDDMFDLMINLDFDNSEHSTLSNVETILHQIHDKYPILLPEIPESDKINEAFTKSLEYKPPKSVRFNEQQMHKNSKDKQPKQHKVKKIKPSYFSLHLELGPIRAAIDKLVMQNLGQVSPEAMKNLNVLFFQNRFLDEFHVTLCHFTHKKSELMKQQNIWNKYLAHYEPAIRLFENDKEKDIGKFLKTGETIKIKLVKLIWDTKIVTLAVEFLLDKDETFYIETSNGIVEGFQCANITPHITIGLLNDEIRPYYSNSLCEIVRTSGVLNQDYYELEFKDNKEYAGEVYINL